MAEPVLFDPESSWDAVEKRLADERDPVFRQLLEQVRDHVRAEIRGEIEPLMATLVAEPEYHFRSSGPEGGPKGRDAVRSFYEAMIAGGGNRFHFDIERIFVDAGGVVTEGKMRQTIEAEAVLASGVSEVDGRAVDPAETYLTETHILTVWPAGEDNRLVGEDIFFGSPPSFRSIRR
jgi:hypothetical protein